MANKLLYCYTVILKVEYYQTIRGFIKVWNRRTLRFGTRAKFMQSLKKIKESINAEMLKAAR